MEKKHRWTVCRQQDDAAAEAAADCWTHLMHDACTDVLVLNPVFQPHACRNRTAGGGYWFGAPFPRCTVLSWNQRAGRKPLNR